MKVVLLIPNLEVGGPQRLITEMLSYDRNNVELYIVSLWGKDDILSKEQKLSGRIRFCTKDTKQVYRFRLPILLNLIKEVRDIQPDVIHSHLWAFNCIYMYFLRLLLLFKKVSFCHTIHSSGGYFIGNRLSDKLNRLIEFGWLKLFRTKVISISQEIDRMLKKRFKFSGVYLVHNGVDVKKFPAKDYTETNKETVGYDLTICFAARYQESKGHKYLIDAVKILKRQKVRVKAYLLGGNIKEALGEYCKSEDLEKEICFTGDVTNVAGFLRQADFGVFPSLYEGFPVALIEMMSVGLPVVASNIESIREVSMEGVGAILVPVKSPEAIAEALLKLHRNREDAVALGKKARTIIKENFSFDKYVKKHLDVYNI